jgi:hypothetical protein
VVAVKLRTESLRGVEDPVPFVGESGVPVFVVLRKSHKELKVTTLEYSGRTVELDGAVAGSTGGVVDVVAAPPPTAVGAVSGADVVVVSSCLSSPGAEACDVVVKLVVFVSIKFSF